VVLEGIKRGGGKLYQVEGEELIATKSEQA
jgi:hypothetical protein